MAENIKQNYDLLIIGTGPAGLAASLYASRYAVDNIVIGKLIGGMSSESARIENFPAEEEISGLEWSGKMQGQVEKNGGVILADSVSLVEKTEQGFKIFTDVNGEMTAKTILIASGTERRKLGIKGEEEFRGRGVTYCATCDGLFFKGKKVAVIGGGDSAATAALYLADIAEKVYLIHRKDKLRAEEKWVEELVKNEKIEIILENEAEEFAGSEKLEKIILKNLYNGAKELEIDGAFIEIGSVPSDGMIEKLGIEKDEKGFIKIASGGETNVAGVWAAGDITNGSNNFHQIITACSEGAIAANSIHKFLKKN